MKRYPALCVGLFVSALAIAGGGSPGSLPESKDSPIGYKTVAEALASLRQAKQVSFSVVRGWTIVTDEAHLTVWSFAPRTDPSYPAVVRRMVTSTGTGSKVTMSVLCEASKASCADLVREFSSTGSHGAGTQLEDK